MGNASGKATTEGEANLKVGPLESWLQHHRRLVFKGSHRLNHVTQRVHQRLRPDQIATHLAAASNRPILSCMPVPEVGPNVAFRGIENSPISAHSFPFPGTGFNARACKPTRAHEWQPTCTMEGGQSFR